MRGLPTLVRLTREVLMLALERLTLVRPTQEVLMLALERPMLVRPTREALMLESPMPERPMPVRPTPERRNSMPGCPANALTRASPHSNSAWAAAVSTSPSTRCGR